MNFVHPGFLFALTALAIPVIIHLFSFRRYKRIYFPSVRFLKELKEETRSYQRLKHLLILLMRLLTLTFLVFAFAQPYIPLEKKSVATAGPKAVHLFIDNSFSMQGLGKSGSVLEEAKRNATDIIRSHKASDQFQVLTNDFEAKHQRYYTRDEAAELVNEIYISPVSRTSEEILQRQKDLIHAKKTSNASMFLVSDFQRSAYDPASMDVDSTVTLHLIPVQPEGVHNIFIDSIWFPDPVRRAGKRENLHIRIKNISGEKIESVPLKLFINNIQKGLTSVTLEEGATKDTVISFVGGAEGIQKGKVVVTDYPVSFDDAFYFSYMIPDVINVLIINGSDENPYLNSLLGNDSTFNIKNTSEKNLDYSTLKENHLIVLHGITAISSGLSDEMKKFMENGGSVLLVPPLTKVDGYDEFLNNYAIRIEGPDTVTTRVQQLIGEHPLFTGVFEKKPEDVDLPEVKNHFKVNPGSRSEIEMIMRMPDGLPFISKRQTGKGQLYISASAFSEEAGTFVKHALFVPLIYNIALFSTPPSILYYTIGEDEFIFTSIASAASEQVFRLKSDTGRFETLPEIRRVAGGTELHLHNSIRLAGNYDLMLGTERITSVSFNYNRNESEMSYYSADDLKRLINKPNVRVLEITNGKAAVALEELSEGKKLWKLCIILALLFVLAEILIIKFWKNEAPLKVSTDR